MHGKASSRFDHVVVHDEQGMKTVVCGILVFGERESETGMKPTEF
jgi:hypothetical protein